MSDTAKLIRDIDPCGKQDIYPEQDPMDLDEKGTYCFRHVMRMTKEKLHSKAEIAQQLGARDLEIDFLREQVEKMREALVGMECSCMPYAEQLNEGICQRCQALKEQGQ